MTDAGAPVYCDIAASCLCGGEFVHAENVPADGVIEATVFASYNAQITATFGDVGAFAIGDVICVNQSIVGQTILAPVQNGSDAAQVVLPPPDGGTCVPNVAYTVALDDAGRPLACNAGIESSLSLTEKQAVDALRATSCTASLAAIDSRWSADECSSGGCNASPSPSSAIGVVVAVALLFSFRRARPRGSSSRRASTR